MSEPPPVRVLLACASGRKLRKTGARTGENLSRPVLEAAGAQLRAVRPEERRRDRTSCSRTGETSHPCTQLFTRTCKTFTRMYLCTGTTLSGCAQASKQVWKEASMQASFIPLLSLVYCGQVMAEQETKQFNLNFELGSRPTWKKNRACYLALLYRDMSQSSPQRPLM
ncbi:hypothetical protein DUNSADRAFT_17771 [Dunaliella salina]|uniref:Encoded protein n=1 Tax=Dunaliella salina TaxID=3046 RepID=A0ABQ7G172_DUNSA|nr:hypothetical protein DUNSADRAFT_17771 [Dunaliella salina]|eukprot:KAF5828337.1 hypothetical protein DUNSADRAFT_17771 [Dunaliella salina]